MKTLLLISLFLISSSCGFASSKVYPVNGEDDLLSAKGNFRRHQNWASADGAAVNIDSAPSLSRRATSLISHFLESLYSYVASHSLPPDRGPGRYPDHFAEYIHGSQKSEFVDSGKDVLFESPRGGSVSLDKSCSVDSRDDVLIDLEK